LTIEPPLAFQVLNNLQLVALRKTDKKDPERLGPPSHLFVVLTFDNGIMIMDVGKLFVSTILTNGGEVKTGSMIKFILLLNYTDIGSERMGESTWTFIYKTGLLRVKVKLRKNFLLFARSLDPKIYTLQYIVRKPKH
jgi:hypothetical protein